MQGAVHTLAPDDSRHFRTHPTHPWRKQSTTESARALWMAFRTR